jgi:hypothetical protein
MISLRPIDPSNYQECIALSVAADQRPFVASNVQSIADAYVGGRRRHHLRSPDPGSPAAGPSGGVRG